MTEILLSGYNPYFKHLAKELKKQKVSISYWCSNASLISETFDEFPNTIFHDHFDLIKGRCAPGIDNENIQPVCPTLLNSLSNERLVAFDMFDRNDTHAQNFSYSERRALIMFFIEYWVHVIEMTGVSFVVFDEEPHQVGDYLLWAVAKALGKKSIMFIRTGFNRLIFPVEDFCLGSPAIRKEYLHTLLDGHQDIALEGELQSYLSKLLGDYEGAKEVHLFDALDELDELNFSGAESDTDKKKQNVDKMFFFRDTFKRLKLLADFRGKYFFSDQKQKFRTFEASNFTYLEHLMGKFRSILRKNSLLRYYNSISQLPDLNEKFVFFPLQYQPEKTTNPLGGVFEDQIYAVRLLSKHLPKGWKIYVKEHPSQFLKMYARYGEAYRSEHYYNTLNSINNVKIASMDCSPFDLIDKSICVATVTGNAGWEALCRGKPAICFGAAWYKDVRGVVQVTDEDSIRNAFRAFDEGFVVEPASTSAFLLAVEKMGLYAAVGGTSWTGASGFGEKENGELQAHSILKIIRDTQSC